MYGECRAKGDMTQIERKKNAKEDGMDPKKDAHGRLCGGMGTLVGAAIGGQRHDSVCPWGDHLPLLSN